MNAPPAGRPATVPQTPSFPRNRSGFHPRACSADPKQRLIIIKMIQVPAPANSFYRRAVRYLAYQALSDSD